MILHKIANPGVSPASADPKNDAGQAFEALMLKKLLQSVLPETQAHTGQFYGPALDGVATQIARSMPLGVARLIPAEDAK